jgi:hypothetical protein
MVEAIKATVFADSGLTVKQARFLHAYLETGNATGSYRCAYDCKRMGAKSIETEALRLLKHPGIALGIDRFRRSQIADTLLTLEEHMAKLRELRDVAKAGGQLSAAIRAEELRGKLCGLYAEPIDRSNADEFANMTNAELRTFVIEESRSLGLHVPSTNGRGNGDKR